MADADLATPALHSRHIVLAVGSAREDGDEIVTTLLRAGFDAIAVETAGATLALMGGGHAPCVLLLDLDAVPDADAWRLWDRVVAEDEASRPTVLLLSRNPVDAPRARVVDVERFLRMPLAPEVLIEAVERHCPRRLFPKFTSAAER